MTARRARVTLVNQFYPPDLAPTGRLLEDVAQELAARGHEVRVVCSRGAYGGGRLAQDAAADGRVHVRRVPALGLAGGLAARLAEDALFCAGLAADLLLAPKPEVVLSLTTPPYVGLVARAVAGIRGSAHAHWVMDVYPDAVSAHGLVARGGRAWRALERLARWQWKGAGAVVTLGPRMARRVERYADPSRTSWVAPWPPEEAVAPVDGRAVARMRERRGLAAGELVLLCSGRLGLGHRLDDFLEAAARLGADGPAWAFAGSGPRAPEVERFARAHPAARVSLHPPVAAHELGASLASGDVHLVGVAPEWAGVIAPSRLQAAFAAARPVLYVGPDECEAADWVRESGGGWVAAPGDVAAVVAAVEEARDPAARAARGGAARAYAAERFDRASNRARVADLVEGAAGAAPPPPEG
jgi:glycosyltransferase involved in cell wall biosynthesis